MRSNSLDAFAVQVPILENIKFMSCDRQTRYDMICLVTDRQDMSILFSQLLYNPWLPWLVINMGQKKKKTFQVMNDNILTVEALQACVLARTILSLDSL